MTKSQPSPHLVADTRPRILSRTERLLGPRPALTLVVQDQLIREIWVEDRAPIITIYDYDWGETDPCPAFDQEGFAFSPISWRRPAWMLGLSLHSRVETAHPIAK
jgi:ParB family chromosome partitioning protein